MAWTPTPTPPADTIKQQYQAVQADIEEATRRAGRDHGHVNLVAVTKTFDGDAIRPVIEAGQNLFGENRVQEAQGKWPALKAAHPNVQLHLIGPLQSNKADDAVALFDVIETVDRPKIAKALKKAEDKLGLTRRYLIQVNTGEEPQKAGIAPSDMADFVRLCHDEIGLAIDGLMCIPPVDQVAAPHFAFLRKMAHAQGLGTLSMGMSGDYPIAIQQGATHIRLGSAIFGQRA